ncbi:protein AATF [Polistes fuscatus]|uniref:protein AATF n=1 Tax=Polistes fuscatus TaxID=30207 RepID=UPI001CA88DB9|nr:protein AATF [Polistes fuscatus]
MALNKKKTILADKISSLINAAPTNIISDDENEETKAKVVERYEESDDSDDATRQSKIRKQNVQLLDEFDKRYEGKKVSRKDVYKDHESNSDDEEPDAMEDESADETNDRIDVDNDDEDGDLSDEDKEEELTEESKDEDEDEDEDDDEYEEEEEGVDKDNPLYRERDDDANFKTMSAINVKEEMEKGQCIKNQLRIWESLLEMRIKLQQCLAESNQMPQYDTHKSYRRDADFMKRTNEAKSKLTLLLDNMLNLQKTLLKQFPETKSINGSKKVDEEEQNDKDDSMDEEIPSDTEDEGEEKEAEVSDKNVDSSNESNTKENNALKRKSKFVEYEKILNKRHKSYVNYRNSVISKWDEKTRMATTQLKKGTSHTTIERIDFALSDKVKLLKMTQLKRSEYDVIGKSVPVSNDENKRVEEYDPEIFDDDDFYGQLLKDLIECKSSDIEPEQLQKYRIDLIDKKERERRKMKKDRKVDTRASKGRKVRYNVHNKLVNYMAPITVYDTWTDVSKNELYNSLFGKIKPVETIQH